MYTAAEDDEDLPFLTSNPELSRDFFFFNMDNFIFFSGFIFSDIRRGDFGPFFIRLPLLPLGVPVSALVDIDFDFVFVFAFDFVLAVRFNDDDEQDTDLDLDLDLEADFDFDGAARSRIATGASCFTLFSIFFMEAFLRDNFTFSAIFPPF